MDRIILPSYAKINLGLILLGKREDGYHDICTVFQQIDLCDEMAFQKTPFTTHVTSTDPTLPSEEENLAFQAFHCFQKKMGIQEGIKIHIKKNIPIGSGLGGGSSNAAITLTAANILWGKQLSKDELREMAVEIGSDVPFFLLGGTALGQGRGEILTPIQRSMDYWVVLVYPGINVSTSWAYGQVRIALTKEKKLLKFSALFEGHTPQDWKEKLRNDLKSVVFQRYPALREIEEQFYKRDAFYASMSGSGSSVYGLYLHHEQAEAAHAFFSIQKGKKAFLCRPISSCPSDERSQVR